MPYCLQIFNVWLCIYVCMHVADKKWIASDPSQSYFTFTGFTTLCVEKRALTNWIFLLLPRRPVHFHIVGTTYCKSLGVERKRCNWNPLSPNNHTRAHCALQENVECFCGVKSNPRWTAADVSAATWRCLIAPPQVCDAKTSEKVRDPTKTYRRYKIEMPFKRF